MNFETGNESYEGSTKLEFGKGKRQEYFKVKNSKLNVEKILNIFGRVRTFLSETCSL